MEKKYFNELKNIIEGDVFFDDIHRVIYSTDASAYREKPLAVCIPENKSDLINIVKFASKYKLSIIPRAAGTSLAGQVVGNGLVVDVSKHFSDIFEINTNEKWVSLQPGVVLDELNKILAKDNLFFGPETSTSNRCMIGGMVGNNSSGAKSIVYQTTREHVLELECILSDGSEVVFKDLSKEEFNQKCKQNDLEGKIYRQIKETLENSENAEEILKQFPNPELNRRNTGYALDLLLKSEVFSDSSSKFNFCKLLAGSEGTLAIITRIKLNLVDLPPKNKALVCVHVNSLEEAFRANLIALKYSPDAVELMDKLVLDLTKDNITQNRNRFFIEGEPEAIIIAEWSKESKQELDSISAKLIAELKAQNIGYSYPIIYGGDIQRVWALRKAGLGILSNMPGDSKPVPVIEDVAVSPQQLEAYVGDLTKILDKHNVKCVYYAHIGAGELHIRPILNLKTVEGKELFKTIAYETAKLVKKYNGSLSGEHGDGRLRGEFIPIMLGEKVNKMLTDLKNIWDPEGIFNAEKIINTPSMNSGLRFKDAYPEGEEYTYFDFSAHGGILRSSEKCNGSADCRKSHIFSGGMCPSFQVTKDEIHSTRARANILREMITYSGFNKAMKSKDVYKVFELCLLCKACKSECPSNVDVAKLKMEFLQHYYNNKITPLSTVMVSYLPKLHKLASITPSISNYFFTNRFASNLIKKTVGFHENRSIPLISIPTFSNWHKKHGGVPKKNTHLADIVIFNDEFTNYLDSKLGVAAIKFFRKLGYNVEITEPMQSARTYLSKGMIKKAKKIINKNISKLKGRFNDKKVLIGIEPSAILGFKDEYVDLVNSENSEALNELAQHTFLFDEFVSDEIEKGNINTSDFTRDRKKILFHGHCQQKSLTSTKFTHNIFEIIENYEFEEIPSGCCGMGGSFGYEKKNYEISNKIGELILFPAVRKSAPETIIVATGTSCRCQIKEGTGREALHPVEVLEEAAISKEE